MMNERIRELYRQAHEQAHRQACEKNKTLRPQNNTVWNEFVPLFAELIVRECVSIVAKRKEQAIDDGCNVDEAMSMAEMDLEEHFGVKE
jgi:hypothetical protein